MASGPVKETATLTFFIPLKTPKVGAMIQTTNTAIFMFLSVIMFEYYVVNVMALSLSKVTNIRWK